MTTTLEKHPAPTAVGSYVTSDYPPFPFWTSDELPRLEAALNRPAPAEPLSLYLRMPFRRKRCHCCTLYPCHAAEDAGLYFDKVLQELSLYRERPAVRGRPLKTVYVGGSSPLDPSETQLKRLLEGLREGMDWSEVEEFTFECEPGMVSPGKLKLLKDAGVTRVSLDFQTLNNAILRRTGRHVSVRDCFEAFALAREAGFHQVNVDLLAGLPGEQTWTWRRTIERMLELVPDSVTIRQSEPSYESAPSHSVDAGRNVALSDWPAKRALAADAFETLEHVGYTVVSTDMAVRDPKHWRSTSILDHFGRVQDLLALGESSSGHIQGVHYQNAHSVERYIALLDEQQLPWRCAYHEPSPQNACLRCRNPGSVSPCHTTTR